MQVAFEDMLFDSSPGIKSILSEDVTYFIYFTKGRQCLSLPYSIPNGEFELNESDTLYAALEILEDARAGAMEFPEFATYAGEWSEDVFLAWKKCRVVHGAFTMVKINIMNEGMDSFIERLREACDG